MTRTTSYDHAVKALAATLHGAVVLPDDPEYAPARAVHSGAHDRFPSIVVRPLDAEDVRVAVTFAREWDLAVAVRSGGHSFAGHGTNDGGIVVDLSAMKAIRIDAESGLARIEPGLTWGEVAAKAHEHGLALTSGAVASVGVGGLAVGGGIGWMVRKHGLTIDNLLSAEVVTADGRILRASATEHPDLFWAIRGGGGNFGIVTAFEFRMHPAGLVLGGAVFYDAAEALEMLEAYARYAASAPDELTTMAAVMPAPPAPFIPPPLHGTLVLAIMVCYTGDLDEGRRVVAPLRRLGTPIADMIAPMSYPAMFAMTEGGTVRGLHHGTRSLFLRELDGDLIRTIVAQTRSLTAPISIAQIRALGGAMARVAPDATAFAHRDKPFMLTIIAAWADPAASVRHRAEVERFWRAVQSHAAGVYVNFLGEEGEARIRDAYGPATYARLAELKRRYDPANLFRLNQNIPPAGQAQPAGDEERAA
jgi:FAD/FMN-containing dehydrogenase